jgi:hypothetical protein
MLTDHLYRPNKDQLPVSTHRYGALEDVLSLVDTWKADLVFFVSAYGLMDSGFRPLPSLEQLVRRLRERGCRLVTTDPILGLPHELRTSQVNLPLSRLKWRSRFRELRNLRRMFGSFSSIARMFEEVTHLYPVPTQGLASGGGVRRVSFFNPQIVRSRGELGRARAGSPAGAPGTVERSWLFIVGASDLKCQFMLWGADQFAGDVLRWLERARLEGRRPLLIAPQPLVDNLSRRLPAEFEAELIPFCSYPQFISRLFDAEYVFYWNTFSCSILLRLANALPVFFFDQGHIPRLLKPCEEAGIRCYYGGVRPAILDARQPLGAAELERLVAEQQLEMQAVREYWKGSPAPGEVIDRLLGEPAPALNR